MRGATHAAMARTALILGLLLSPAVHGVQRQAAEPLTIMTFNIRYGTAADGANHWSARRAHLFEVIRREDADLLGLQEALDFQVDEILEAAPMYAVVGVGRDDGAQAGEYSAILFRRDRLHVAEAGTFWFSDTPSVPGSKSSQPSRERSTVLLRQRIAARAVRTEPVVVTGDFNVGETNPAILTLTAAAPPGPPPLVDTFRVLHAGAREAGTGNAFTFGNTRGDKIDYVLVPPGTEVLRAEILRNSRNSRYPSDHFPVVARVRLAPPP